MTSPGSANRSHQMGFPTPARRSMQSSQAGSLAAKPVKRAFGSSLSRGLGAEGPGADRSGPSPADSSRSHIRWDSIKGTLLFCRASDYVLQYVIAMSSGLLRNSENGCVVA